MHVPVTRGDPRVAGTRWMKDDEQQ